LDYENYYYIMPDGTTKQISPFTGTEVWAVPGRGSKPNSANHVLPPQKIKLKEKEDYCSFCETKLFETPPEKERLVKQGNTYSKLEYLPPNKYTETVPSFRRVPNLFEIVTLDYWKKNYGYKLNQEQLQWREDYLSNPIGKRHIIDIMNFKLQRMGRSSEEIEKVPDNEKIQMADSFFGGSHDIIIARRHFLPDAEYDNQLNSSGNMTPECHYQYVLFTIESMVHIFEMNRYARYISIFQNWLSPAGASVDHLHKQLVALDEWGSSITEQTKMVRQDPNIFNEYGPNFAGHHNLVFAENEHAIAFVGIGHRFPTMEVFSKSHASRPQEHTHEEIRGMSNMVHAIHAAAGSQISCNEEWYYTPIDSVYKMPWRILIKWRINVPAGFEGGTSIYINPMTPVEIRDRLVPALYKLREEKKIEFIRIAEECRMQPNPLKYYLT
jgi:galactose-1-phosphate uridylyltransferase